MDSAEVKHPIVENDGLRVDLGELLDGERIEAGVLEREVRPASRGVDLELQTGGEHGAKRVLLVLEETDEHVEDRVAQAVRSAAAQRDAIPTAPDERRSHHRGERMSGRVAMEAEGMEILFAEKIVDADSGPRHDVTASFSVRQRERRGGPVPIDDADMGRRTEAVFARDRSADATRSAEARDARLVEQERDGGGIPASFREVLVAFGEENLLDLCEPEQMRERAKRCVCCPFHEPEAESDEHASRRRARHGRELPSAVRREDRLRERRACFFDVALGDEAAPMRSHLSRERRVEIAQRVFGVSREVLERRRQVSVSERLPRHERRALARIEVSTGCGALGDWKEEPEDERDARTEHEAVPRELDGGRKHGAEGPDAPKAVDLEKTGQRERDRGCGRSHMEGLRRCAEADVHGGEVDFGGAAPPEAWRAGEHLDRLGGLTVSLDEHHTSAERRAQRKLAYECGESGGDGGVDRVAAFAEEASSCFGGLRIARCDYARGLLAARHTKNSVTRSLYQTGTPTRSLPTGGRGSREALTVSTFPSRPASIASEKRVARFAWTVLAYNLAVIAWGAFVRASGSGAGCGRHWPLCNGEVIPRPKSLATVIELSHRVTSGFAVVLVVALLVLACRGYPRGHRVRRGAGLAALFIFGEAIIGAFLVLLELVAYDASLKRGMSMILHLGNTFFLLAALSLTAWWASTGRGSGEPERGRGPTILVKAAIFVACGAVLVVGASGAIAALGDTLFPARTLREGLAQDWSPTAHAFVRLRLLHPIFAIAAASIAFATAGLLRVVRPTLRVRRLASMVVSLVTLQVIAGLINVSLLAPVWMQLTHLLLADAVWIALVLLGWEAAYAAAQVPSRSRNGPAPTSEAPPSTSNVAPVTYAPAGETK